MKSDELKNLQQELEVLKKQLDVQQQQVMNLQKRIYELTGEKEFDLKPKDLRRTGHWSMENFIGLRIIHFIGIIVLVVGLSIGVKYAIDRQMISETLRIILAYGVGFALYYLSRRLKKNFTLFSAILFSGAIASLYFTTYAACVYYGMVPGWMAFLLMIVFTVYTVFEAISYNRQEIALLGLVGAYGIPFLISQNSDRAELFFLYITVINISILYLCVKRSWMSVFNRAMIFTWLIFILWAGTRFEDGSRFIPLAFMFIFFFLFFLGILSTRILGKRKLSVNNSYHIVLNNLALYTGALLVFGWEIGKSEVAFITLLTCIFIGLQGIILYVLWKEETFSVRILFSIALMFFIMFIGFNWDGFTVTLLWLFTAVVIFALGFRLNSVTARMLSILLYGVTLGKLLLFDSETFSAVQKVIAYIVLGILLLVVSFFYQKFRKQIFGEEEGDAGKK